MSSAQGIKRVGYFDSAGGGQIYVEGNYAFLGHVDSPPGTTILDVSDPKKPVQVAQLEMPPGTHSHKVRVANGLMVINRELNHADPAKAPADFKGGLGIYDVSDPRKPRHITDWVTHGKGVHRYDFDGRYVYCSPTAEGYLGNIMMILDLKNPEKPEEAGRWWLPGQWTAGGETPSWNGTDHRCHHPLRMGNRLYTSYWHGGFYILDIEDMSKPKLVSGFDWSPPFACPTHSAVPIPFEINGRRILMVADEDVFRIPKEGEPAMLWFVDITVETRPIPFASFQVDGFAKPGLPPNTGCHQPVEKIRGTEIPVAWFEQGLRVIDISKPHAPREVAHYVPDLQPGSRRVSSNDVYQDDRGLIYLADRHRGLEILERT